jgi:hypothetical protein
MKPHSITHDPSDQEIQHAAYYLWQEEGRPTYRDLEIWLAAKERLKHTVSSGGTAHPPKNAVSQARSAQAANKRHR